MAGKKTITQKNIALLVILLLAGLILFGGHVPTAPSPGKVIGVSSGNVQLVVEKQPPIVQGTITLTVEPAS